MLIVAASAVISKLADIEDSTRGSRIEIGERCVIDAFVKIKPAGGVGDVLLGEGTYVNSGTVIYSGNGVRTGKGVLIAANCTLAPVNHEYRSRATPLTKQGFMPSRGGIIIEDDVWIGAGSVILDGVHIRQGAIVGAMSLVRGDLDAFTVYAGSPLVAVGKRT